MANIYICATNIVPSAYTPCLRIMQNSVLNSPGMISYRSNSIFVLPGSHPYRCTLMTCGEFLRKRPSSSGVIPVRNHDRALYIQQVCLLLCLILFLVHDNWEYVCYFISLHTSVGNLVCLHHFIQVTRLSKLCLYIVTCSVLHFCIFRIITKIYPHKNISIYPNHYIHATHISINHFFLSF